MRSGPVRFAGISLERDPGLPGSYECTTGLARKAGLEICVLYFAYKQSKKFKTIGIYQNYNKISREIVTMNR